ncbi:MAG: hypothetical protein JEY99_04290 [Spirochaetales bacterium]|nr:hypothetical protein [Spirochaetales bacterium]
MEDKEIIQQMAVEAFNRCWEYIDKPDRTKEDDGEMLTAALTQKELWDQSGSDENRARGEWQVSRVYALLAKSEKCLHHAEECMRYTRQADLVDFDLVFAYEAMARAYHVLGDEIEFDRYYRLGLDALDQVKETEDREYCRTELESIQ